MSNENEEEEYTGNPQHRIPGMVCWNELHSLDPESSKTFYSQMFDWEINEMEMPGGAYTMFHCGQVPVAGLVQPTLAETEESSWIHYVTVTKLEDAIAKAKGLEGSVIVEPTNLPQGRFAIIRDPQGAQLGLFEYGV